MNRSQTALLHAKEPQDAAFCASPVLPTTQLAENRLEAVREAVDAILLNCPDPLQVRDGAVHLYGVAQACALIALRRGEDAELAAIAGMLHDLSTYADAYTPDHAARSAALARTLLRRLALFSAEEIERVCAAIACHSNKAHAHTAFAEVLLDADVLQHGLYNPTLFLLEEEVARFRALQQEFSLDR